jgi:hypothetical protein
VTRGLISPRSWVRIPPLPPTPNLRPGVTLITLARLASNSAPPKVIATVSVDNTPRALAVNPEGSLFLLDATLADIPGLSEYFPPCPRLWLHR